MLVRRRISSLSVLPFCVATTCVAPHLSAAPCDDRPGLEQCHTGFSAFLDNDSLLLDAQHDEDRNYTMGLQFQWSGRWIHERGLTKPLYWLNSLEPIAALRPSFADSGQSHHTLNFGNVAFTPDDLTTRRPIRRDRPYASLLYLDTLSQVVSTDELNAYTTELSVGLLGLSISEHFQSWLHRELQDSPDEPPFPPKGWDNQISDGGEPTARYTVRWQHSLTKPHPNFDLQWIGEGSVGYHTAAGTGAALRVGKIESPWWQFNAMPISQAKAVARATRKNCSSGSGRYELYGWGGSMARLWGYNVLLQGQFRDSEVTVDSSDVERFVYDYSVGITAGLCTGSRWHRLTFAYSRRSPEFEGPLRRYHSWGGLYYSTSLQRL